MLGKIVTKFKQSLSHGDFGRFLLNLNFDRGVSIVLHLEAKKNKVITIWRKILKGKKN